MRVLFSGRPSRTNSIFILLSMVILLATSSCKKPEPPEPVLSITTLATGLLNPMGLEVDKKGRVWVAQAGTAHNDGKVTVITPDGKKYDVITDFPSVAGEGGDPDGLTHLMLSDGILYVLGTGAKLYKANVANYNLGDAAVKASTLSVENIGAFVLAYNFQNKTGESHPYNLTMGPNGDIFITDAAANAILRRTPAGVLSVVAELPLIPNPTPVGGPMIEPVPTGIIYDGNNFLVSTLRGFPFLPGVSSIYKVSPSGALSEFQTGFTSLVDIAPGTSRGRLVLQHGVFGAMGFGQNTGKLIWATGSTATPLAEGLNLPSALKQADEHTWYVSSLGDHSVLKVTY